MSESPPAPPPTPQVWRCWSCGRIIARLVLVPGSLIEVKCKCSALNVAALPMKHTA